ncbi:MAG TPA: glycosyltransferase [Opitutaceae bacterium]|nr:glycosyltransferase [Opitutaceae bacterium]
MPLRILLATIGSSGDVHPVIALGRALQARGHAITVVTNEIFSEQVRESGLEFVPLGTKAEAERLMNDPRLWDLRRGFGCIVDGAILPNIRRLYEIIEGRPGPSTVVAATTLCLGARVAQDRLGVPTASIHLQPGVFRSLVDSGRLGYFDLGPGVPRPVKRMLFWFIDALYVERRIGPGLNAFRSALGLAPVRGIFSGYIHSPQMVLGLFPEWFAAPQVDWPRNTHLTGFILHDAGGRAEALAEADDFLGAGPPPVLVTPGSAAVDRSRFFLHTVKACQSAGVRAMLVTNHPGQLPGSLPPGIRAFPYVAFSRILPRCAAVAYHGGIGTLAQAVRAGVPHLIVPNAHDQPDNGQRIERLGLGLSIGPRSYRPGRAARAIGELLRSPEVRERCREFAPKVDGAAALKRACALIEQLGQDPLARPGALRSQ